MDHKGFIIIECIQEPARGAEPEVISPVCVPIHFIKGVSRVAQKSGLIEAVVPAIGVIGINMMDGGLLFANYSFEDFCKAIGAINVDVALQAVVERSESGSKLN